MVYVTIASLTFAVLCLIFALRCYQQLWSWARQCQQAQIAVAYKGKVKMSAPLVEWLLWCRRADMDKHANGQVVYSMGGTAVAVIRGKVSSKTAILRALKVGLSSLRKRKAPKDASRGTLTGLKTGTWSARDDKTGARGGNA